MYSALSLKPAIFGFLKKYEDIISKENFNLLNVVFIGNAIKIPQNIGTDSKISTCKQYVVYIHSHYKNHWMTYCCDGYSFLFYVLTPTKQKGLIFNFRIMKNDIFPNIINFLWGYGASYTDFFDEIKYFYTKRTDKNYQKMEKAI